MGHQAPKRPFPRTVKEHHDNVRALRCVVTENPSVTLHHTHSGSMADNGYVRGTSQRGVSEALVIPLKADFHCFDSHGRAIDGGIGVRKWESFYGAQMTHIKDVSEQLGYDLFVLHERWIENPPKRG